VGAAELPTSASPSVRVHQRVDDHRQRHPLPALQKTRRGRLLPRPFGTLLLLILFFLGVVLLRVS